MKRLTLAILATAIGLCANAQQQTILQGRITDSERHEAMAGVTVYAEDGSAYTSSNGEGRYVLKLNAEQARSNIVFSMVGYRRDTVSVAALLRKPDRRLAPNIVKLREVSVEEYKKIPDLVQAAVARIPRNFHCDTTIGTFFFRDCRLLNNDIFLFDEMVFDALRVGYDKHHKTKKLKKGSDGRYIGSNYKAIRYDRLLVLDTAYVNSLTVGLGDVYSKYFDEGVVQDDLEMPYIHEMFAKPGNWTYSAKEITDAEGHSHYLVTMRRKKEKENVGAGIKANVRMTVRLTIEYGTLAITKIETNATEGINKFPLILRPIMRKVGLDSVRAVTHSVQHFGEVGGRHTLTSYNDRNELTLYCAAGSRMGAPVQHLVLMQQGYLTRLRPGNRSFLRRNNIQPAKAVSITDRNVGEVRYDDSFWQQYNYVPLESDLKQKLERRLKRGKQ